MMTNGVMPHVLANLCSIFGSRLIHFSTDCVFQGDIGNYIESDEPNPSDIYGKSKLCGEVLYPHTLTLRTSIIGRELYNFHGLLEWFLRSTGEVNGYLNAMFSGLTTVEVAHVLRSHVLLRKDLSGLYHLGGQKISKYDLLLLIKNEFGLETAVTGVSTPIIDRTLDTSAFSKMSGYCAPTWSELISNLRAFSMEFGYVS